MAPPVEISIPNTSTASAAPKPYTIYHITLRLPLRSYTVPKRYSDFTDLHAAIAAQVGSTPPVPLPPKRWFSSTTSSPALTEDRRRGLEEYLKCINGGEDARWRNCSAWRAFLNLPSTRVTDSNGGSTATTAAVGLHAALTGPGGAGAPITDSTVWLDCHRDVKAQLHDARLHLTRRDQASTPQKQHEASAQAKSCLVKAGTMINALDQGLKILGGQSSDGFGGWSGNGGGVGIKDGTTTGDSRNKLGDGELRRRKDLIGVARKEREGLENLLNAMAAKSNLDAAVAMATAQNNNKDTLLHSSPSSGPLSNNKSAIRSGRVLGKETNHTRELDNQGVLQLQKQILRDQDLGVEELRKIVARQKELGQEINEELEIQNEMLRMVDDDAERVQKKVSIAKKRVGKIS